MPNFFALDSVLQIKPSERGHGNPFVRELPVEEHSSLVHGQASPAFKCFGVDQEVHVFLIKLADNLICGERLRGRKCLPANVLDFVFGQVQSGCYGFISGVLERLRSWLRGSESDH